MPVALRIDRDSPLGAAEQLKAQLRAAIRAGELRPGTSLARVRALGAGLGLNPNTVAGAYRDLAREGLVVQRGKGGTRVAPGPFLSRPGDEELRAAADHLVILAHRWSWSGGDALRLVAGRWFAPIDPGAVAAPGTRPTIYELLRTQDYDES